MSYNLTDKTLSCIACQKDFVFTKGEQKFYLEKAFSEPKRCIDCRRIRKKDKRKKRRKLMRSLVIEKDTGKVKADAEKVKELKDALDPEKEKKVS